MATKIILLWSVLFNSAQSQILPPDLKLGVATASYQIEGGWNANGKGVNIWDELTHTHPDLVADHTTGDVACDSYHLWQDDLKMLKFLKVDHYRFSLSWSRLLPGGFTNQINPDGVAYYNNLINALITEGIEPMVTLYHWDLPQNLQNLGGWTNPLMALYFENYARVAFYLFGGRVKTWITINEPSSICVGTYEDGDGAPAFVNSSGIGLYLCGRTILLAHAAAYRVYDAEFRKKQGGRVGITIDSIWAEPKTNNSADVEAATREMQFGLGWWAHPIFSVSGNYPSIMISRVGDNSKREHFMESRLPPFTPKEIKLIQGSSDFFGLNHYHTWLIANQDYPDSSPSYHKDKGTKGTQDPDWEPGIVPWGFRKLLNWIKNEYNNPLVIVTENGYGDGGAVDDVNRVVFLKEFMRALVAAIHDGCNVKGYTVWSVMDNMEWRAGYTVKFGLHYVNFTDVKRTRTPKCSAYVYATIIKNRVIPGE
jgi:beta-glucosidase/6-phospho-beta-glucosidase/beta-galactosidase